MKSVRTYKLSKDFLWCTVDFIAEDSDWDNDVDRAATLERYPVILRWTVGYISPKNPFSTGLRLSVHAHPNVPQDIILSEMEYFINTIKQMYTL